MWAQRPETRCNLETWDLTPGTWAVTWRGVSGSTLGQASSWNATLAQGPEAGKWKERRGWGHSGSTLAGEDKEAAGASDTGPKVQKRGGFPNRTYNRNLKISQPSNQANPTRRRLTREHARSHANEVRQACREGELGGDPR